MRILIVTDAWHPQVNGVVTTMKNTIDRLRAKGHECSVIEPSNFVSLPLPGYKEIRVAINPWTVGKLIEKTAADSIHIVTEGPLGLAARVLCKRRGLKFTTSLHTKFPEYIHKRIGLPVNIGYRFLRWFHEPANVTLATTSGMVTELEGHGLSGMRAWGRGVDCEQFVPGKAENRGDRLRPKLLYVGRVAVEKNIEAFLDLPNDAEKIVVGDGPQRHQLQKKYPSASWLGYKSGDELAACYAEADVFVFPSRTDTFGIVMLEALACGTPIAGYPVTGPLDVVEEGRNGALSENLAEAVDRAMRIDRDYCRQFALRHSWDTVTDVFERSLVAA
jgi:glycosyltransferase involved in cell wall biosynthesis